MKKIVILLWVIILTLPGCSVPFADKEKSEAVRPSAEKNRVQYAEPISIMDVIDSLEGEGLQLDNNTDINPVDYEIDGINPVIYSADDGGQYLLVYDYQSIEQRKKAGWTGGYKSTFLSSKDFMKNDNWYELACTIRNILILHELDMEKYGPDDLETDQVIPAIKKTFLNLNDVQTMVFADQGSNFEATVTVKYYKHWYQEDQGKLGLDQYANQQWQAVYLGNDPESIRDLSYEYEDSSGGGGSSTHAFLKQIGANYGFTFDRDDGIPATEDVYTITFRWDGQEETLELTAVEP